MKEYALDELGYFTEDECMRIRAAMQGKTFMRFGIDWSNCCGNCTLIITTDYEDSPANIKHFFLHFALSHLGR